ncbi:MAG: hypothetical protein ABIE07_00910 [Candidatus Zixiibacteriota bacterium]
MILPEVAYIQNQISNHISLFFNLKGKNLFESGYIRFLPYEKAITTQDKVIAIPYDIEVPQHQEKPYTVKFNNTKLTLWNGISNPSENTWEAIPGDSAPLWYRNQHGTLIPAWNLYGNLFHLLTFAEEKGSTSTDSHGRFAAAFSPRLNYNLLEVPAFNEAVAAIVAAYAGLCENGYPFLNLNNILKPPVIVLSHDCDILRGNDIWTQTVRGVRIFLPLIRFRLPAINNIWWIIRNAFTPRRYYFDNAAGMVDLERCFGFSSTFYLINGKGGRFGARSGFRIIPELLNHIPPGCDTGMHYNYDTFLNDKKFRAQLEQLTSIEDLKIVNGRAHYLKFDPEKSFTFIAKYGIYLDESSGYADRTGYRNGIAGCFQVYDTIQKRPLDIWELPMTIMDSMFVGQYCSQSINKFNQLLYHLSCVGGALSINFHPGQFFNPEYKQLIGIYHKMLIESRILGAVSMTARSLMDQIR